MKQEVLISILGPLSAFFISVFVQILRNKDFKDFVYNFITGFFKYMAGRGKFTHHLFINGRYYQNLIKDINFECPEKTALFRSLLHIKIEVVLKKVDSWLKEKRHTMNKLSSLEFRNELKFLTTDIIETYEGEISEGFFKLIEDREQSDYVFNLIYYGINTKHLGFKEYHEENIKPIKRFIEAIPIYVGQSNSWLFNAYMNQLDTAIFSAIHDVKDQFDAMNSHLCPKNNNGKLNFIQK